MGFHIRHAKGCLQRFQAMLIGNGASDKKASLADWDLNQSAHCKALEDDCVLGSINVGLPSYSSETPSLSPALPSPSSPIEESYNFYLDDSFSDSEQDNDACASSNNMEMEDLLDGDGVWSKFQAVMGIDPFSFAHQRFFSLKGQPTTS